MINSAEGQWGVVRTRGVRLKHDVYEGTHAARDHVDLRICEGACHDDLVDGADAVEEEARFIHTVVGDVLPRGAR